MKSRILILIAFFALMGFSILDYTPNPTVHEPSEQAYPIMSTEVMKKLTKRIKITITDAIITAEAKSNGKAIRARLEQREKDKVIIYTVMVAKQLSSLEVLEIDAITGEVINQRPFREPAPLPIALHHITLVPAATKKLDHPVRVPVIETGVPPKE